MIVRKTTTEPETIVPNDGKGLYDAFNLDEGTLKHIGNFVFTAKFDGADVTIYTEPYDEEQECLLVKEIVIKG